MLTIHPLNFTMLFRLVCAIIVIASTIILLATCDPYSDGDIGPWGEPPYTYHNNVSVFTAPICPKTPPLG